jgi:hypothetical protein
MSGIVRAWHCTYVWHIVRDVRHSTLKFDTHAFSAAAMTAAVLQVFCCEWAHAADVKKRWPAVAV